MAAVVPIQEPVRERTGTRPACAPWGSCVLARSARGVVCGREPQWVSPAALHPLRYLRRHRRGPGIDLRIHRRILAGSDRLPGDRRLCGGAPLHAADGQAADAPAGSAAVAGELRQYRLASSSRPPVCMHHLRTGRGARRGARRCAVDAPLRQLRGGRDDGFPDHRPLDRGELGRRDAWRAWAEPDPNLDESHGSPISGPQSRSTLRCACATRRTVER